MKLKSKLMTCCIKYGFNNPLPSIIIQSSLCPRKMGALECAQTIGPSMQIPSLIDTPYPGLMISWIGYVVQQSLVRLTFNLATIRLPLRRVMSIEQSFNPDLACMNIQQSHLGSVMHLQHFKDWSMRYLVKTLTCLL